MSDTRAAAERIIKTASMPANSYDNGKTWRKRPIHAECAVKVARTYLSEHPPDELLPPTVEWVTERLGEGEDWSEGPTWVKTWDVGCALAFGFERHGMGGALLVFGALDECDTCKPIHTRRQFLQLCEGLGVEVKS